MWLYLPYDPSHSSQALADSEIESALPHLPPNAWLTARGKLMQQPSLSRAWKRSPWMRRLSGLVCAPSQASGSRAGMSRQTATSATAPLTRRRVVFAAA